MTPAAPNPTPLDALRAALDLDPAGVEHGAGRFVARSPAGRRSRLFGGLSLAQVVVAAARHLDRPDMCVRSLHASFLRAGSPHEPVELTVTATADGRTLAARHVVASQGGTLLIDAIVRFHVEADRDGAAQPGGEPAWPPPTPPTLPEPETLPTFVERIAHLAHLLPDWASGDVPIDVRYVDDPRDYESQTTWARADGELGDVHTDHLMHVAALIYASDMTLLGSAVLPFGRHWADPGITMASLDHAIWFHRPPRADAWMAYEQRAVAASGGRALVTGTMRDRDGHLVATVTQDGLVRIAG